MGGVCTVHGHLIKHRLEIRDFCSRFQVEPTNSRISYNASSSSFEIQKNEEKIEDNLIPTKPKKKKTKIIIFFIMHILLLSVCFTACLSIYFSLDFFIRFSFSFHFSLFVSAIFAKRWTKREIYKFEMKKNRGKILLSGRKSMMHEKENGKKKMLEWIDK